MGVGDLHRPGDRPRQRRQHDGRRSPERRGRARPLGPRRGPAGEERAVGRTAGGARRVADDESRALVQVVERGRVGVGRERALRAREDARVAQRAGDADLVQESVVGGARVVLLGAEDEERIVRIRRGRVVRVRDVAVGAVGLRLEDAVDEDPHPAVRAPPLDGHVVPPVVEHAARAADREVARAVAADAEDDDSPGDRNAELAVGAGAVAVHDHVAVDPGGVGAAGNGGRGVVGRGGPHPELDREVARADVGRRAGVRVGRVVDRDLDAVDVGRAVAVEAQRRRRERGGRRDREKGNRARRPAGRRATSRESREFA